MLYIACPQSTLKLKKMVDNGEIPYNELTQKKNT